MWLFLATEVLLFAGLFCGYAVYRFQFPLAFEQSSRHLNIALGTVNTVVLITSSFTVAMAIHFARSDKPRAAALCLAITIVLALGFLGIKAVEYTEHFREHALPGKYLRLQGVSIPGAADVLHDLLPDDRPARPARGDRDERAQLYALEDAAGALHVEVLHRRGARRLYWHLVDLVWIFLYPLLYLI